MNVKYRVTDEKVITRLKEFKLVLIDKGYTTHTAKEYVNSAREYLSTGRPLTKDSIDEYYKMLMSRDGLTQSQKNGISSRKMGIARYYDLFYGDASKLDTGHEAKHYNWKRKECNYDCLNCIHPKCIFE